MKILVPVDGSEISTRALKHALALARSLARPGRLLVVAADDALFPGVERKIGAEAARKLHEENFARLLAPARKALARSQVAVEFIESVGVPADAILEAASKRKADLVVMGSRGSGGIKGTLLGSVSMKVLAGSKVPVTIVH